MSDKQDDKKETVLICAKCGCQLWNGGVAGQDYWCENCEVSDPRYVG